MNEFFRSFFSTYGYLIVSMGIQALLALSLYLPLMCGQLSLASPGFYALGGYVAALMSTEMFPQSRDLFPLHYIALEMIVAAVLCTLLAIVIGFLALRLRGIFLALATIAFVEIFRVLALNLVDLTGGAPGIPAIPQPFNAQIDYLILVVPLLLLTMLFVWRLENTRVGRAFTAVREDELAAAAIGINPMYYKVLSFVLGAILAGIAGVVSAHVSNTWNPSQGTFNASILILAYVLVGGSHTLFGPVIGGMFLTLLPEALRAIGSLPGFPDWLSQFLKNGRLIIYGALITVSTLFFPQGLLTPELFKRKRKPEAALPLAPVSAVSKAQE